MQINLSNIFIEIENFLFQLLFFLVLIPKTIIKGISSPKWIHNYITEELKKGQKDQFKEYMNPLFFFLASYVVTNIIMSIINISGQVRTDNPLSVQNLLSNSVNFLLLPIPFSVGFLKISGKHINETDYKRAYYMQLIISGIGFMMFYVIGAIAVPLIKIDFSYSYLFLLLFTWLFFAQTTVFYTEFPVNKKTQVKIINMAKAVLMTILCSIISLVIIVNFYFIEGVVKEIFYLVN